LGKPFASLGKPFKAYICDEPECEKITAGRDGVRIHCSEAHRWKSTKAEREHWHQVWVQTFFSAAGLQRYFIVDYQESEVEEENAESSERTVTVQNSQEISTVLHEWDQALQRQEQARQKADAELAKTDRTGWFTRTRWPQHLANSNLRHLSQATRLPDQDEIVLQRAVELVDQLIERSVSGLATLDDETRRWLRSAKLQEPDTRPLSRLQNPESQAVYAGYMRRFVCYSMRVYKNLEEHGEIEDESASEVEGESGSGSRSGSEYTNESGDDNDYNDNRATTNIFRDARRLFPWQDNLKEKIRNIWEVVEGANEDEAQMEVMLEFFRESIFRRVRGKIFDSALMHFLAVLGINEEANRLREGNDFSYILAGVVYCTRVLAVEILLPSAERDQQTDEDEKRFREQRDAYLADGSYSVMSKMISLLAYGKHIALNHGNAGAVMWSRDGKEMTIRGMPIVIARFRKMVHDIIAEAEDMLWRKLMWTKDRERFEIALHKLEDDVTFTKRGVSFITNPKNKLEDKREWMLNRALGVNVGRKMRRRGEWVMRQVRAYLREIDRFREKLLFCVHLTGGQPARGTEITTIRFRNGYAQDRNIFAIHGHVVVVTRYHKSQSQLDKPKVIPRFLPWRVGQLLALYLVYVQPFQEYLSVQVKGSGWSDYVWANEKGPWETDRLTRVIKRETESRLGAKLTTHDYRHTAISIGRRVVGEGFAHGYAEEIADIEEPEVETDDALEMSAGRGGEVGANRYGVSVDVIKHLSGRTVDTFRPLSEKWHEFLELSSYGGKGQKRGREERSSSVVVEQQAMQEERRMALALRNNGVTGWERAMERCQAPQAIGGTEEVSQAAPSSEVELRRGEVSEERMEKAVRKVLQCEEFSFRSKEQGEALRAIMRGGSKTALVVVLPTGGGKSLLFMAPACLDDPGVTIVVVQYRALINNLVVTARKAGIDCIEWRPGEVNPAALVYVSADFVPFTGFLGYARLLQEKGLLRRVFVDECHLAFTASDWRPKMAWLPSVRGLRCPTIMLTATLPLVLEFELEASMAAETAKYIRAVTTRVRTRYIVHECKAGAVEEEAMALCRRMQKHLGFWKGVVYSRSRAQCERIAGELKCAYYHAGAVDNEERLASWLEKGGLIVATSALGTGVDFPGVVFVLHVDLPYGMIDFAQESGRAGRAGEDVDSVIMVAEKRVEMLRGEMRGVDDSTMGEFATTRGCRRRVMSLYFDGTDVGCEDGDGEMARCDGCGEGLTALERTYRKAAQERQVVEETLEEVTDGCAACWVMSKEWAHAALECKERRRRDLGLSEEECDGFRQMIRYEGGSHSCHRCGISQKLCATGRDDKAKCQWPNVLVPMLRGLRKARGGMAVLGRVGFDGEEGEWAEYGRWLGRRHPRRVWGEVVSNATAVLIAAVVERRQKQQREEEQKVEDVKGELMEKLQEWDGVCMICRAARGMEERGHTWRGCRGKGGEEDEFRVQMMQMGVEQVQQMARQGGGQWIKWHECGRDDEGGCEWCGLMAEVAMALLYVGVEGVREWAAADKRFEQETDDGMEGMEVLERFFRREMWCRGVESNGMSELVRTWG
jgi:superfamily II DNA helicase RecQ